jgi:hypothetical protein
MRSSETGHSKIVGIPASFAQCFIHPFSAINDKRNLAGEHIARKVERLTSLMLILDNPIQALGLMKRAESLVCHASQQPFNHPSIRANSCREWAPDHSRCEWLRGRGGLPPARRPGSASSLSVSAARRRLPSRTQSQVLNAAVLFNPISNFRLHFETAQSAFSLDKDSEQIRSQNLQSNESSRDCYRGIVRSEIFFFYAWFVTREINEQPEFVRALGTPGASKKKATTGVSLRC